MSEFASRYFVNVSEKEFFLKFNHKCVDFLDFKNLIFLGHKMLLSCVPQFLGVFLCNSLQLYIQCAICFRDKTFSLASTFKYSILYVHFRKYRARIDNCSACDRHEAASGNEANVM